MSVLMDGMPSQLRASVFFDLPSESPQIAVKDGSATATLDSILDAAATAPVSAFTDHAFAGKLGKEVYGAEKKKKKKTAAEKVAARESVAVAAPESKKRGSFLSLMGHVRKNSAPMDAADRRTFVGAAGVDERSRLSRDVDGELLSPGLSEGGAALAPDEDEQESSEGEEEEGEQDDVYAGPPTTLLAELLLRKQQQKLRTRPINQAFPNGMHTTLLELDAVAEVERKTRRGRRVNLAWEDTSPRGDGEGESDDEEVPLGMLYAARAAGGNDISAVAAELNRPLGLMQKKDLEDNEPLSRRRDRLQGRETQPSMYLAPGAPGQRQSTLTLTPTVAALQAFGAISAGQSTPAGGEDGPSEEEIEGESLGERMRRLKAKEEAQLPRARPVSQAFSEELLGAFVDPEEEKREKERKEKEAAEAKAKENARPDEEGETLGQRRRRLQAEKEAAARNGGIPVNNAALLALTGSDRLSRRISMADVLTAHPLGDARGATDPREAERRRREEEAARAAADKDFRMAAFRGSMVPPPASALPAAAASTPNLLGAPAGGFMGGRFNDGGGGGAGFGMGAHRDGPGVGHWAGGGAAGGNRFEAVQRGLVSGGPAGGAGIHGVGTAYPAGAGVPMGGGMGPVGMGTGVASPMGVGMQMPMGGQMGMNGGMPMGGMGMGMPPQHGQVDMVERWRQGVLP